LYASRALLSSAFALRLSHGSDIASIVSRRYNHDMSRPSTLPAPWDELALAAGGVSALAGEFEVARLTLYRWAHSEQIPSALVQRAVNAWARRRRLAEPFATAKAA
jgi:hypothetical protein